MWTWTKERIKQLKKKQFFCFFWRRRNVEKNNKDVRDRVERSGAHTDRKHQRSEEKADDETVSKQCLGWWKKNMKFSLQKNALFEKFQFKIQNFRFFPSFTIYYFRSFYLTVSWMSRTRNMGFWSIFGELLHLMK